MNRVEVLPAILTAEPIRWKHSGGEEDGGARIDADLHGLRAVGYGPVLALLLHACCCQAQAPCAIYRKVSIHHEGIGCLLPMLLRGIRLPISLSGAPSLQTMIACTEGSIQGHSVQSGHCQQNSKHTDRPELLAKSGC